jgi:DNA invertase Pin-like site-specific DNA recombinase
VNKFALCIIRVSTDKQKTDLQRHALEEELQSRKLVRVEMPVFIANRDKWLASPNIVVMVEDVATGRTDARKGYQWAEGQVKGGWVSAVICYSTSRLGRSVQNNLRFAQACVDHGTELYSLRDKVDITSPAGKMIFTMLSAAAAYESDMNSERTRDGIAAARAKAEKEGREYFHGGTAPGWLYKSTIKKLPKFKELVALGFSNYHICQVLGINYRTCRKLRNMAVCDVKTRKELNTEIYGKSNAVI